MEELQTDVFSYLGTAVCDLISQYIGDFLETYWTLRLYFSIYAA